jgi:hypothetical protein
MQRHVHVRTYMIRSNVECKEKCFFFFFLQKILTQKYTQTIHKHKARYLQNTSTPPCHIVHNVTENTKPRGWVDLGIA